MSNMKFGPPGFKINSAGKWECTRCGHVQYVRGHHVCLRHQNVVKFRPHKEGHKLDKECHGKAGKGKHKMLQGCLKCDFCWPLPVGITEEMRVPEKSGTDTTEK